MPEILVVDDDRDVAQTIKLALKRRNFQVQLAYSGMEALKMLRFYQPDLIILDVIMPGIDGFQVCRRLRTNADTADLPIIFLTARGQDDDRIEGLRAGADDYLSKPFNLEELILRVEAVLRRSPERPSDVDTISIPGGVADLARCEVRFEDGDHCGLSERERELLRYLACNAGRAISRDEILSRVWRINPRAIVETRTIDMHITRLREKLRDDPSHPRVILTARGKGYMFAAREEAQ